MMWFRNNVAGAAYYTNYAVPQQCCRSSILYKLCGSATMLPEQHPVQMLRFHNNVAGAASCTNGAVPQQCCRSSILYKFCIFWVGVSVYFIIYLQSRFRNSIQMMRFRNNVAGAAYYTNYAVPQQCCRSSILYKLWGSATMLPEQHPVQIMRFRNNVAGAASCTNVAVPQQCCRSSILYKWCGSAT
jgi:hypothetical protein